MSILLSILVAVAVVAGLGGALAAALSLADRYLNDYGQCAITVNNSRTLSVQGGASLLSSLMSQNIFIPSACGGRGTCGLCKVKVLQGGGPLLPTETPYLNDEEQKSNVRLSCQVKVRSDVSIQIPEALFAVKVYQTRCTRIRELTYDTREFTLELAPDAQMDFVPGQYVQFEIPPYGNLAEPIYRAYSMACTPSDLPELRFLIRRAPNGIATTFLFDYLKQGDTLRFNGPYGEFRLSERDSKAIFIAGGVGMSAIFALLKQLHEQKSTRAVDFFFGVNTYRDLFYLDEVNALVRNLPNVRFIVGLARKEPDQNWDGEVGLVTEILDRHIAQGEAEEAYLCGGPGMIDACIKVLQAKGIGPDHTYFDKFA